MNRTQTVKGSGWPRTVMIAVICLLLSGNVAYAATLDEPVLYVQQSFITSNGATEALEGNYALKSVNGDEPLPEGAKDGIYTFSISGTSYAAFQFGFDEGEASGTDIRFIHAGIYEYEVRQVVSEENEAYTYDRQVYHIRVAIYNEGNHLAFGWLEVLDENGMKPDAVVFTNLYDGTLTDAPGRVTGPGTGDSDDIAGWFGALTVSAGALTLLCCKRGKP